MSNYTELLKHPNWQKKRLEIMHRADFRCEICGDNENMLQVHHLKYRKGAKPWEYGDEELACLCESCHEGIHKDKKIINQIIERSELRDICFLRSVVRGWSMAYQDFFDDGIPVTFPEKYTGLAFVLYRLIGGNEMHELLSKIFENRDKFDQIKKAIYELDKK